MTTEAGTTEKPLRKDAERNRQRVLAAARELFAERGLEVTMDDIAHHAGVGVGTVYRRFPDRELLIDALFEDRMGDFRRLAEDALEVEDPWEGLVEFLERSLEMQAADRGLKSLVFSTAHGRERIARVRKQVSPLVDELVRRAQASGDLRPDLSPTDLAPLSLSLGATADFAGHISPDIWRRYFAIVLDGLRTKRTGLTRLEVEPLSEEQADDVMRTWRPPGR